MIEEYYTSGDSILLWYYVFKKNVYFECSCFNKQTNFNYLSITYEEPWKTKNLRTILIKEAFYGILWLKNWFSIIV